MYLLMFILGMTVGLFIMFGLNMAKNMMFDSGIDSIEEEPEYKYHYVLRKKDYGSFIGIRSPLPFHEAIAAFAESQNMDDGDIIQVIRENTVLDMLIKIDNDPLLETTDYSVQMIDSVTSGIDIADDHIHSQPRYKDEQQ